MIFCAELFEHYKPHAEVYLGACGLLNLPVMLCAVHNTDLRAARGLGLKTVFVTRQTEYGPYHCNYLKAEEEWGLVLGNFIALSERLRQ